MIVKWLDEELQTKVGVRFSQLPSDLQWFLYARFLGSDKSDEELLQEWRAYEARTRSIEEGSNHDSF